VEVATLVVEYLKALVWPAVVLIALLLFRDRLHDLFGRLTSLEAPGGVKANFSDKLADAQERLVEVQKEEVVAEPAPATEPSTPMQPPETSRPEEPHVRAVGQTERAYLTLARRLVSTADEDPARAVTESWAILEGFMHDVALHLKLPTQASPGATQRQLLRHLGATQLEDSVEDLRDLRDNVAHQSVKPSQSEAQSYLQLVRGVIGEVALRARQHFDPEDWEDHG
jgi:hypothetical protein